MPVSGDPVWIKAKDGQWIKGQIASMDIYGVITALVKGKRVRVAKKDWRPATSKPGTPGAKIRTR